MSARVDRLRRHRGFTLVELMVVVVIVAVLASAAVIAWHRVHAAGDADAWANVVRNAVTFARRRATATGTPYLIELTPTTLAWCQVDAPTCAADGALSCAAATGERASAVAAGSDAVTDAYAGVADVIALDGTYSAPAKTTLSGTRALFFGPNGSADLACSHVLGATPVNATGFTVYVHADSKRRRVVVYGATGRTRIIDNW
jgi:prepilin-type N-terminal cleavage/methylation domain-containing protein